MKNSDVYCKPKHITSIGGQALIEGLMMMGPNNIAIAVRKPDGEIIVEKRPLPKRSKFSKLPLIRGVVGLFKQMVVGIQALMFSAEFVDLEVEEDEKKEPSKVDQFFEKFLGKVFGNKLQDALIYISVVISLLFSVGLFILLPNFIAGLLPLNRESSLGVMLYNLVEGIVKIILFFSYIVLISKLNDIKRVWQYHGAEHKTIHCYENGEELTVENIQKYSTRHPRCGTSFLFTVMVVSILVFSFAGWYEEAWKNMIIRLLLLPVVAGISYEVIKFAGKSQSKIVQILNVPGLMFQNYTTKEPDDSMVEVAIEAMKGVLETTKEGEDKW
ncbi:DUF1385 domain-containing protein [Acetivibrio clariflavus]|uniref:Putative metal-dependent enzyme n=1 Tax=Acetivibrio clariflavus (strain DSM 19732 / NBRC 101661 / EBR45) TaxID=720554 RepID=G8LZF7_ACECE|nr:DUF1385 domain-containing protein [Acetivibrio clariflavus]AEV66820.1 putative metal-dependent enzyme [Acetivibrio clariflavus DSM 19732]